jgi:hypothetical protein
LRQELLGQGASDHRVILGSPQKRSHPFEGIDKFREIFVGITVANFFFRNCDVMLSG